MRPLYEAIRSMKTYIKTLKRNVPSPCRLQVSGWLARVTGPQADTFRPMPTGSRSAPRRCAPRCITASDGWKCLRVDAISIESCDWWSVQLTSTACAGYDAQCRPRQRDRPRVCPLRSDCPMPGLTSMDSSGCSSPLTLIACAGCHAHCRSGQRDRPIACPLRRDWRCNAPAENCRATNCSCASPDRKACDDSSNNWTRTSCGADFPALKSSAFTGKQICG